MKANNFDVLKRMSEEDNQGIKLAPLDNITHMRVTKKGTKVTIGVQGDVLNGIALGKFFGGLLLVDREQFEEVKKKIEAGQ